MKSLRIVEEDFIGRDDVDRVPSYDRVTKWDIAAYYISILSHLADVGLDCNLAYVYYKDDQMNNFLFTLGFILVPAFINTALSIRMYMGDAPKNSVSFRITRKRLLCVLVLIFQLAPVLRYYDSLRYALKSRKYEKKGDAENQRKYYELMLKEDSDVALLRVLECFLEAAPQQILQITIILITYGKGVTTLVFFYQLLSIGSSFGAMAWSMASYQRLIRFPLKTKNNISWKGTVMQFMWHFLVTVSRILSISVLASVYLEATVLGVAIHWLVMTVWLSLTENTQFCNYNKLYDLIFFSIFGMVYIFTHISLSEGRTRFRYIVFYSICFAENTAATLVWYLTAGEQLRRTLYFQPLLYLNLIPFAIGIAFMMVYYKWFHPSTKNRPRPSV